MSPAEVAFNPKQNRGTLRDGLFIKTIPSYYSSVQASQWLDCIKFPQKFNDVASFPPTLENLAHLVRLHLIAFPFENTQMHYTPEHIMDVTHEGAFRRLVLERQGSYCFGQNGVLLGMLRALGYRAYSGAARVNSTPDNVVQPTYTSLSHMVIFVQPIPESNETYVVDVGFGSTGLVRPILLSDASDNIVLGTSSTEKHRLTRSPHPSSSLGSSAPSTESNFSWNLEVQHSKKGDTDAPWKLIISFTENEYFPLDYENASFVLTHKPEGIFWANVLGIRYIPMSDIGDLDEESKAQIEEETAQYPTEISKHFLFKYVMRGFELRRSIGSSSVVVKNLKSEAERIRALRELFGLDIPDAAEVYMRGREAAFP